MTATSRYFAEDPSTTVLKRRCSLQGYELYLVEQWACSRAHPTFVIVTFTGDPSHSVTVGVLSIPTDQDAWSPKLRLYFKAMLRYHARRKQTHLGTLMVTNLSGFPSALTVILVPDGNIKEHREDFIVNEDLKRLGCSGRAGLNLSPPSDATQSKFYQLYKISDHIPLQDAVIELVKLCQVALMLFGNLGSEYADGLLCDVTERAINDWWSEVGRGLYKSEPRDGILGPTTVAAILGMLMGARNRLGGYGAPVPKDAFEVGPFKRGIAYFQKSQKLAVTRRLNRETLDKLHKVTAKAASGDGWMVPRTVKTTVAELSGKGGEMVMGMVGARDKPGIAEIETLELERFVQLVYGERCKWLWYGKPRKSIAQDPFGKVDGFDLPLARKNTHSDHMSSGTKSDISRHVGNKGETERRSMESSATTRYSPNSMAGLSTESLGDREFHLRRNFLKSMTGRRNDARSGFERIKDAVGISGLRGHHHHHRLSKEDTASVEVGGDTLDSADSFLNEPGISPVQSNLSSEQNSARKQDIESSEVRTPIRTRMEMVRKEREAEAAHSFESHVRSDSQSTSELSPPSMHGEIKAQPNLQATNALNASLQTKVRERGGNHSVDMKFPSSQTIKQDEDTDLPPSYDEYVRCKADLVMQRRQSWSDFVVQRHDRRHPRRWPRHVSFSVAEETILKWSRLTLENDESNTVQSEHLQILAKEAALAIEAKRGYSQILQLRERVVPWVQQNISDVEQIDAHVSRDQEQLHAMYYQNLHRFQNLSKESHGLLVERRNQLIEAIREIDILGARLDYEVNTLAARVEDVEAGVEGIERQVFVLEAKAHEFEVSNRSREGWLRWGFRLLTGIGNKVEER